MRAAPSLYLAACLGALPWTVAAQSMAMQDMPGMAMPATPAVPAKPATQDHPHDTHDMPAAPADGADHRMHGMAMSGTPGLPANDHVPPAAPQSTPQAMSPAAMTAMMQMDDNAPLAMFAMDRLERSRSTDGDSATAWEAEGWYGGPIDRLWFKSEGERDAGGTQDARLELLWSHAWTSFWDGQLGVRQDFGQGPNRAWLALGVEGLAPYWLKTQVTFYAGEQGRSALRLETSYDLRFTQRLILAPQVEVNVYGKRDPQRGVASGLSDAEAGLRLRYEISRQLAPYVGVDWTRHWADAPAAPGLPGRPARETRWVAGLRWWF